MVNLRFNYRLLSFILDLTSELDPLIFGEKFINDLTTLIVFKLSSLKSDFSVKSKI